MDVYLTQDFRADPRSKGSYQLKHYATKVNPIRFENAG